MLRAGEKEYRERLRNKDLEIAGQLDKIEVCVCVHMCACSEQIHLYVGPAECQR